jgi:hypothetical protein
MVQATRFNVFAAALALLLGMAPGLPGWHVAADEAPD